MLTESERSCVVRPVPEHLAQGDLITWPRPLQVGQVRSTEKKPCAARTRPAPPQVAHVEAWVPGLAPEPEHSVQETAEGTRICAVFPAKASSSETSIL